MNTKFKFEGTVKRIYEETRGQYTSKYVVMTDNAEKYPNILCFRLKPNADVSFGEGARVAVEAFVDGREWTNPQGQVKYFTDLTIATYDVLGSAAPAAATGGKPTKANDWKTLLAVGAAFGEGQDKVTERCKAHKAKVNRQFTPEDWQAVADCIIADHNPQVAQPDPVGEDWEMPF